MRRHVMRATGAVFMVLWIVVGVAGGPFGPPEVLATAGVEVIDDGALASVTGGHGACTFLGGVSVGLGISTLFGCGPCAGAGLVVGAAALACEMVL